MALACLAESVFQKSPVPTGRIPAPSNATLPSPPPYSITLKLWNRGTRNADPWSTRAAAGLGSVHDQPFAAYSPFVGREGCNRQLSFRRDQMRFNCSVYGGIALVSIIVCITSPQPIAHDGRERLWFGSSNRERSGRRPCQC